jgi:hypothetical protein
VASSWRVKATLKEDRGLGLYSGTHRVQLSG